jgi:peptidyl-prolyl isomerase E (cyclophilin E)
MSGQALYVGGLDEAVTLDLLRAAFLPFGHVKDAQLPLDAQGAHKGFAFIEFEAEEDAQAAIDNMEGAELFGRTIRVNPARGGGGASGGGAGGGRGKAVWADAEGWYKNLKAQGKKAREGGGGEEEEEEGEEGEGGAAAAAGSGGGGSGGGGSSSAK